MTNITPEEIARLRALEAKATPGPWREDDRHSPAPHCVSIGDHVADVVSTSCSGMEGGGFERDEDRMLSIAARNALPRLLDEIERLRAENDRLRIVTTCTCWMLKDTEKVELRADLAEAVALLRDVDEFANPVDSWQRCDALLAKHKEDA